MNPDTGPSPKPGILDIEAYVGGRAHVAGVADVVKLSSNESPLGPSPKAMMALTAAAQNLQVYPDGSSRLLRDAIAKAHGIDPARIVCGGDGSGPLLTMLANAYLRPGDEAVFSRHAFLVYEIATRANSAVPVMVPERTTNSAIKVDVEAMLAAVTPRTRLLYLANPNNPTGSYLTSTELRRLHAGLPRHVLLVIDAAYCEFVTASDYETGMALVSEFDNVAVTRTFSKAHGLAGIRLGWCYGPAHVCDVLNRIRGPFNTSMLQQHAGAAAIADAAHLQQAVEHNGRWIVWLTTQIRAIGLQVDDSVANFVLIHFPGGPKSATLADEYLSRNGVILRGVASYGLPQCLRMTVGTEAQNRKAITVLRAFMQDA